MAGSSTRRFSDRAGLYDLYRPGYPPGLVPLVLEETGLGPGAVVADVGAGTGLSALPFVERGLRVFAVEPDPAMRERGRARSGARPGLRWREGTAEDTGLPAGSVDLVVAAQAFHWFEPERARREFLRILRPDGWIALVWNRRRVSGTPFLEAYERLLLVHGTDYAEVRHDRPGGLALETFLGGPPLRRSLANAQELDLEGLEGRVFSSSYVPPPDHPDAGPLRNDLRELFRMHALDGRVRIEYETEVFLAPAGRGPS